MPALKLPLHSAYQDVFVYSFGRADIIALIPLVRGGKRGPGALEIWAWGSGVYFGACSGKEKWSAPLSVQTLCENSSYLTKIGLPKPKGHVYFGSQCHCNVHSRGRREGLVRAGSAPVL